MKRPKQPVLFTSSIAPKSDLFGGTVVVAQLVEQSFRTTEIRGSNPVIGKFFELSTVLKRHK